MRINICGLFDDRDPKLHEEISVAHYNPLLHQNASSHSIVHIEGQKKQTNKKKSYIDLINLSALGLSSTEQKTRKHVLWSDESIMSKTDVWLHFPKINKAINFSSTHKDAKASICDGVGSDGIEDLYLWEIQVYLSLVYIQLIMIHLIN